MFHVYLKSTPYPLSVQSEVVVLDNNFFQFGNFTRLQEGGDPRFMLDAVYLRDDVISVLRGEPEPCSPPEDLDPILTTTVPDRPEVDS